MRELFFKNEQWQRHRRRRLQRRRSICSRADRHDRDLAGTFTSDARRRQRLPVPVDCMDRCAGRSTPSRSGTPARSSTAATRRSTYSIKPFGAEDDADPSLRRRRDRRRSRALHRLRADAAGSGSPARASLHNVLDWPSGRFSRASRRGPSRRDAAAGRVPTMTGRRSIDARGAGRRATTRDTSGGRSRRCRCRRTCRLRAS